MTRDKIIVLNTINRPDLTARGTENRKQFALTVLTKAEKKNLT